ncbi:hypothetical protein [Aquimarina algicola]|uniref:Uncharacterized protein n=1 Tax=Aquimarina algicola TaxID=2589995 RepID=A0A504J7T0_9FLAO|nr:hypothetical protein [Aquimarina algicola]TPN86916.1 hypothetical protein FHK87_04755 [Aquimarina algicola]
MKNIIISIFVIINGYQISIAQYNLDTTLIDINHDKIVDTLINDFSRGSACGGRTVTVINGKTNEQFSLSNEGCYSNFIRILMVPQKLKLKTNKAFLNVLKKKVLPDQKRDHIDSSLEWIITGALGYKDLDDDSLFRDIVSPKTSWQSEILEIPDSYYVNISSEILKLSSAYKDHLINEESHGFLIYYPSGHHIEKLDSLTPVAQNKYYKIYKTPHAVFVKRGGMYNWLFISDSLVTGAPDRRSWFSIKQIQLIDKYLIIHQDVPPDNTYNIHIVNIETQKVGHLNFEPSYNNGTDEGGMDTFEVINNQLIFNEYGEPVLRKIPLQQIFNTLDSY